MSKHVVIIGNGIAGVTSARHIRKLSDDVKITIISSETKHFFSRTALMYIYMGHMKYEHTKPYEDWFWEKNRIDLVFDKVESIDFNSKKLDLKSGSKLSYDDLILATGSTPNKFGWPGQDLKGVQGLYSKPDLDLLEQNTTNNKVKRAIIVGGGLIGVEFAEMLLSRDIPVTFLVRENRFWGNVLPKEEGDMIANHMVKDHHLDLRFETELKEITSDENGRVKSIITSTGETIECQLVGLTAGVRPNIDFLKDSALEIGRGIKVNSYLETNIPNVYAIGDCSEVSEPLAGRRPIEAVWYVGRMMGETVARTITGTKMKYEPGKWFNSAKFFDIEYQTYGVVLSSPKENEKVFYWQHPTKNHSFRAVFDKDTKILAGINVFGIRFRHNVCDEWLNNNTHIETVMSELKNANFDPEFYKTFEKEIISKFNKENNSNIQLQKKSLFKIFG